MSTPKKPFISIAMTVFNSASFLAKSIESLLSQDYENYELIISDNASEDGSSDICQEFAKRDNRIKYYRNIINMGAAKNSFKAVNLCSGEFTMPVADHDVHHPSFISSLLEILQQDESIVLAYPRTNLIDENDHPIELMTDVIDTRGMDVCQRFSKIVWEACCMNMVYGLYRTAAIKEVWHFQPTIGPDLIMIAKLSLIGSIAQVNKSLFFRRRNRADENTQELTRRQVASFVKSDIKALVPWTMLAYEHIKIIRESHLSINEKELLFADIKNCYMYRFGTIMRHEASELIKNAERIIFNSNLSPSIQLDNYLELIEIVEVFRYFYIDIPDLGYLASLSSRLYPYSQQRIPSVIKPYYKSCANKTPPIGLPVTSGNNSENAWQKIVLQKTVRLYAGDVPDLPEYKGWIGLSLTQQNDRHQRHDITRPFPLPDNSVDSFQSEDVFEHIPYDRLVPVVNEIFRVLKPNGTFRLSVPDYGCDVLQERSAKDALGEIVFDPWGGGTKESPGHVWFPRIDAVRNLIERTAFARHGSVSYLHYYNMDGTFVVKPVDYSKGHVQRTPDFDKRAKSPYRPLSMIIDLVKMPEIPSLIHPEFIKGMTSIIIPVQSLQLNECIASIKKHTEAPHEIILLEQDAAPKIKKQIIKATKWNQNYKVMKFNKGENIIQSLNEGINQSEGEYIVILFDDVVVYECWLSDMLGCLNSDQKIGIIGTMSDTAPNSQRVEDLDFNVPENRLSFRENNRNRRIHTKYLDGFCLLFRRDMLIQIGLFDVIFGKDRHVFDDFCIRATHEGYINVIAGNVFVHNQGGISRLMSRDKSLFDEKWMGLDTSNPLEEKVLTGNSINDQHTATSVIPGDDLNQSLPGEPYLRIADVDMRNNAMNVFEKAFAAHSGNDQIPDRLALCRNASLMPKYPNVKTLFFFLSQRQAYRPILFSTNEVFCGPDCETISTDGLYSTIKTPAGIYDVKAVVEQLPSCQIPEIVVVKADATRRNFPINLNSFKCPKILIIGNTQHLDAPVRTLLQYASNEPFDFIMTDHKRHHLHFFKEAGFDRVFWLPGVNIYPHEQSLIENKLYDVSFVGQVGRWHPYRKTVLQFLQANGIPVQIMQAPHEKAAEIYAKSLINLNISLNGDFNLRVFEVLSSGGFLLTDRLGRESGLEMIFKDGEHLVCYDSQQDLLEKIRYYLKHPSEANAIAQKGYEEYKRHHTPETKTNELIDFILNGRLNPLYEIQKDSRSIHVRSKSKEDLFQRISTYEYFQDVHLKNHEPAALFFPSVDPRLLCDVSDLPRLRLYLKGVGTDIPDTSLQLFNDTNIADQIHALSLKELKKIQGAWDIVVLTASDLVDQNLEDFLISMNFKLLVVSDSLSSIDEDSRVKLLEYFSANGLEKIHDNPDVFFWKDKSLWGEYLFSKGFTADAVKNFERALADNPANENALNNLGVISYQLNRYEAAEKFMVKAVSLNRRNINSLNNLVQLYMTMERFEDAAGFLLEITGMNPEQPEPWYLLGLCHERLNQLDEAFDAFKKAEKFDGSAYPMPEGLHVQLDKSMFEKNNSQSRILPKKILVINNLYPPQEMGGYGRLLFDFTNILRNRGHSIYVLTSDSPYLGKTDGDKPDVHRSLVLFGGWEGGVCKTMENRDDIIRIVRKNIAGLEQVLKEFRPDACLLGNIDFLSRNIMNPMLDKKIPIIHHMGNQQPGYAVNETPKNRLYHLAAASNWLKNEIQKQGYPLKDISVVFPGALVEEFRMRIPPALDKLRIVYASIVLPYKGPHILINALKRLHDSGIDFYCSIAGTSTDQSFVDSLKSYVNGTGMEEKIHFLGFLAREELKNLLARHNVLVFPSIVKEAFGISQVEAMAAGLTVVTSGTGGAKEIVEHGVSGIIFKTEDDASLAEELIQLTKDPLKCQQIALAGQRRAIEKFDIERSVDSLESCFARLLQTKGIR